MPRSFFCSFARSAGTVPRHGASGRLSAATHASVLMMCFFDILEWAQLDLQDSFLIFFNWRLIALQGYVRFCCPAACASYKYTYTPPSGASPPPSSLWAIKGPRAELLRPTAAPHTFSHTGVHVPARLSQPVPASPSLPVSTSPFSPFASPFSPCK